MSSLSRGVKVTRWTLLSLTLVLLSSALWIRFRFGPVNLEQILLNLPLAGGEGEGIGGLVVEGVLVGAVAPLAVAAVGILVASRRGPWQPRHLDRHPLLLPILTVVVSVLVFVQTADLPAYVWAAARNSTFAGYYVTPSTAGSPQPLNLITIYVESGESSYGDEAVIGENLLADLDRATVGWADDEGLRQYPGGGWTMAGLVADECAIPLRSRLLADGTSLDTFGQGVSHYLPGATCLGDVLAQRGYTSVFLGGSPVSFAGKGTFFLDHGYSQVYGLDQWRAAGEDPAEISPWGLSDHRLFAHAADVVDRLASAQQPFHLSILTLDNHEPAAVYPSCAIGDTEPMRTAIRCSMRAVAGFIDHLRESGALDNTVVVVTGDHLKMDGLGASLGSELHRVADRRILFRVWSPRPVRFGRDGADQLSVLPTTLDLLGLATADGRGGLGVSFVGEHSTSGTALALPDAAYRDVVTAPSTDLYKVFWGVP